MSGGDPRTSRKTGCRFLQQQTSIARTLSNEIQSIASFWRDRSSVAEGVLKSEIETKFREWALPDIYLVGLYELR